MTEAIIFDLWNTIAKKQRGVVRPLGTHFGIYDDSFLKRYESTVQRQEWSTLEEMTEHLLRTFHIEPSPENIDYATGIYRREMADAYIIPGMDTLIADLSKRYKVALLSNTSNFEQIEPRWGIAKHFHEIAYSFQAGSIKPEAEAFQYVLKRLGLKAEQCAFVDDTQENIDAADALGIRGILYKDTEQLREALARLR